MTLAELYANPTFASATYEQQQALKKAVYKESISIDPRVQRLAPGQQRLLYNALMNDAPVIEGLGGISLTPEDRTLFEQGSAPIGETAEYKRAAWLKERAQAGDKDAFNKINFWVTSRRVANETMIGQLALGTKDTIEQMLGDGPTMEVARQEKNLSKVSSWLIRDLTPGQQQDIKASASAASTVAGFTELVALNTIFVGSIGAPGMLTKGIFGAVEKLGANATGSTVRALGKVVLPMAIEGIGSGLVDVMRTLPQAAATGKLVGNKETFEHLATTFGEGVAWDMVANAGFTALRYAIRPFFKTMQHLDLTDEKAVKEFITSAEGLKSEKIHQFMNDFMDGPDAKEIIDQMDAPSKAAYYKGKIHERTIRNVLPTNMNTPEGLKFYAKAGLHDVDITKDGLITLSRFGDEVATFTKIPEAISYISEYTRKASMESVVDEIVTSAQRGATKNLQILRTKIGDLPDTPLSNKFMLDSLLPSSTGKVSDTNALFVAKKFLGDLGIKDAKIAVEVVPAQKFFKPSTGEAFKKYTKKITVPDSISNAVEAEAFYKHFGTQVDNLAKVRLPDGTAAQKNFLSDVSQYWTSLKETKFGNMGLNPLSLDAAAARFGGKISKLGDEIQVSIAGNAPQKFANIQDANRGLARMAMDAGLVDESYMREALEGNGRKLKFEVDPETNVSMYTVRRADGTIEQKGLKLADLTNSNEELLPKLPELLAPKITFLSDTNQVAFTSTYAAGSQKEMVQMLDGFKNYKSMFGSEKGVLLETNLDGSKIVLKGSTAIELEIPNLGFRQSFPSAASAKKFLLKDSKNLDTIEQIANAKGFRLDPSPNGQIIARNLDGETFIVKSREELQKVLKATPDPSYQQDLVRAFSSGIDADLSAKASEKLKVDPSSVAYDPIKERRIPKNKREALAATTEKMSAYEGSWFAPMRSTLEKIGKLTGRHDIPLKARQYEVNKRLVSVQSRKAETMFDQIFRINGKPVNKAQAAELGKLAEVGEEAWGKVAASLGFELTTEHVRILKQYHSAMNFFGQKFGIDMVGMLQDYAPKIRDYVKQIRNDPASRAQFTLLQKKEIIRELFSGRPEALKTASFFAENTRLDAFLSIADNKNIVASTRFYVEHGLRQQYLSPYIEHTRTWLKELGSDPRVGEADLSLLNSYYKAISGEGQSDAERVIAERSLAATTAIAENIRKLKVISSPNFAKALDDFADSFPTTNIAAKIENLITYSTLGFRPIRGITNMMQYSLNVLPIFGSYGDDAVKALHGDELTKYLKELFDRGILNEHILSAGGENPQVLKGILEKSLRMQQNTEYLTRAWTAKAAEMAFDENFVKLANGTIDFKRFVRLSNMSFLSDDAIKTVEKHILDGNPQAARDLFATDTVRTLMFDYSKENYPTLFKGVLGKAFGKFGVYPVGMIDLFRRITTSGDMGERVGRSLRLMGTSVAIYEAFKAVGLDYNGFLFTDPFTFSGGPLYQQTQNLLNSRDTGPKGALARKELAKSWRLLVPFSLQAESMAKAIESGNDENLHAALVQGMSGRYAPDNLLSGSTF